MQVSGKFTETHRGACVSKLNYLHVALFVVPRQKKNNTFLTDGGKCYIYVYFGLAKKLF